jgi:hypothetical protein
MVAESGYLAACGVDRGRWGLYNLWRAQGKRSDNSLSFGWKAHNGQAWIYRLREQTTVGLTLRRLIKIARQYLPGRQVESEVEMRGQAPF